MSQYTHYPKQAGGTGTVTSIDLTAPASILSVSGVPITTSGTIALALVTQAANKVWAGPTTGANAAPTFRSLVSADIPTLPYISTTLGTANGLSVATNTLSLALSSTSTTGALSSTDWNTFNGKQAALTIGNLTDAGTDGIVVTGGTGSIIGSGVSLAQHVADASHNGYLSSTDWSTFNGKGAGSVTSVALAVPALSLFSVTGSPVTGSGTLTLVTTGTSGGVPYFDSTSTLNTSALLTNHAIMLGGGAGAAPKVLASLGTTTTVLHGNASGDPTFGAVALGTDVSGTLQAAQFPALTGDVTTSAGALATTLATVNSNVGSFTHAAITVNGKGLVTAASSGTFPATYIYLTGGSGKGSTNTTVRRFTTVAGNNGGSDLTLTQDATNGDKIVINTAGTYSITYTDSAAATEAYAITVNSSQLTTSPGSITYAQGARGYFVNASAGESGSTSVTLPFSATDTIRAQTAAATPGTSAHNVQFSITRIT